MSHMSLPAEHVFIPAAILNAVLTDVAYWTVTMMSKSYQTMRGLVLVLLIMLNTCMMSSIQRQVVSPASNLLTVKECC